MRKGFMKFHGAFNFLNCSKKITVQAKFSPGLFQTTTTQDFPIILLLLPNNLRSLSHQQFGDHSSMLRTSLGELLPVHLLPLVFPEFYACRELRSEED